MIASWHYDVTSVGGAAIRRSSLEEFERPAWESNSHICVHIYIYIYTYIYICVYIYIYRERERCIYVYVLSLFCLLLLPERLRRTAVAFAALRQLPAPLARLVPLAQPLRQKWQSLQQAPAIIGV